MNWLVLLRRTGESEGSPTPRTSRCSHHTWCYIMIPSSTGPPATSCSRVHVCTYTFLRFVFFPGDSFNDVLRFCMVWYGMVWYGMVWYGAVLYGMAWYGMVWYGKPSYIAWTPLHTHGTRYWIAHATVLQWRARARARARLARSSCHHKVILYWCINQMLQ